MDFFERQDRARRRTKLLVAYFLLAVVLIVAAVYLVVMLIFFHPRERSWTPLDWLWNPRALVWVLGAIWLTVLLGSLFKWIQLRQGGGAVARVLGGRLVDPQTASPDERKLLNVIEEMAIASGTGMPEVYVLDEERGINAFAAGHSTQDVAIGVTDGSLKLLSRDELQGVMAHEFSHILNGDMRLNLRLIAVLNGILCIALIGRILLRTTTRRVYRLGARSRGKGGNPLPLLGLALLIIGSIGVFFGKLIKSAISRQREFLADAAAVQFTRNPSGLAGALKKIGGLAYGSRLQTGRAEEASHLYFSNGLRASWFALMSTHPPLPERIQLLDPSFDGTFPTVAPVAGPPPVIPAAHAPAARMKRPAPLTQARPLDPLEASADLASALTADHVRAEDVLPQLGSPGPEHLEYASAFMACLSDELHRALAEPLGAQAVVYAVTLSRDDNVRRSQLDVIRQRAGEEMFRRVAELDPDLQRLPGQSRLPVVDLTLPALRRLAVEEYSAFTALVQELIESDRSIDLFEFALLKTVRRHLDPHFFPKKKIGPQYYVVAALLPHCATLLSALAIVGHDDPAEREKAFLEGTRRLRRPDGELSLLDISACNLEQLDAALSVVAQAIPKVKRDVLLACIQVIATDGLIQPREAELLRAIADALDCPIPPFVRPAPSTDAPPPL